MNKSDFSAFKTILQGVYDFYGKDLSPFAIDIWWKALAQYEIQTVSQAMSMHCTNPDVGQFCPKPADVVRMVGGSTRDSALMAWNKVMEGVSRCGSYRSVCFDDPIINRVLSDMGGWSEICGKDNEELPFVEKNFCERYRAYKIRGGSNHPAYLVGRTEHENLLRGFKAEPPMLIGDPQEARKVLNGGSNVPMIPVNPGMSHLLANLEAA